MTVGRVLWEWTRWSFRTTSLSGRFSSSMGMLRCVCSRTDQEEKELTSERTVEMQPGSSVGRTRAGPWG